MDLGGIIDHTEQLIGGLQDLGHTVHLKELVWANKAHHQSKGGDGWLTGPSGIPHHQGKGWNFSRADRLAYRGPNRVHVTKVLNSYDLIIWTVPVPSKNKNNLGNNDWPFLYDLDHTKTKQVAFIHDGNAKRGAGHILAIQHHLDAVCCVHPCALNGADFIGVQRALTLNPQNNPIQLIGAIRFMPPRQTMEMRDIAGKGIEYQYLTSKFKCKDAYYHDDGERYWEAALNNGMIHHDYWYKGLVAARLKQARVLVDPSWSKNYSKNGGHFNRVVVDAMIYGCVPVAREMGMGSEVFQAGEHYIAIPQDADLAEYATVVLEAGWMTTHDAKRFRDNNIELLPMFERKRIAQQVIDMAHNNFDMLPPRMPDHVLLDKVEDICFNHFGVLI
jgi:glycosyltransferase involved in cell wall biosynthesis